MADINKEIVRLFQSFGAAYRVADLFRDFVEVAAIVLMNQYAFDDKWELRENRYHEIRKQYAESDFKRFAEILGLLIVETHSHREQGLFADILGCLYMDLGLGNPNSGQYFTPYNISKLMVAIVNQDLAEKLKTEPFVSVLEPTCGSGANVIAFAENVRSLGYTPAQHMVAIGIDIDALCVWMCFIQCQLYRIPAKIVHGNSLTHEFWAAWCTADWILGGFGQAMADRISADKKEAVKYRAKLSQGNGELCSKSEPLSVCYKLLRFITQRSPTWMLCMETIAKVHRLFHRQKLSQREIAKQLKLSRNTVAKYLQHATVEPPVYRREQTHYPKLGPFLDVLTQQLLQEARLPKQQHLSARRHFERLKDAGYAGQYSAVAVFIRKFRQQHQPKPVPVFMAQAFAPGDAYQFDWSIETVCLAGQTVKVNIAHFRLCHSRAFFVCAYPNQKADMLMDAHNRAFAFFGGVPARGIYDNMKTAVTRIGKGKEREFNAQFLQMMTHFLIEPVACTPASGWEKGQVERQIRHLRERLFKPTLAFDSFTSLNDYLQQQCLRLMRQHKHPEYRQPVNDIWEREKHSLAAFRPYPAERLEILKVSNQSLVTVERHRYSVPVEWAGNTVRVYIGAQTVRFCSDTDCIAEHPRSFVKDGISYNPWHFLPYLQKKPGALRDGRAFIGWVLPPVIERLKACLLKQPKGDRVMVKLLNLMAEYDADLALTAAELALDEGMPTPEAVLNIINRLKEPPPPRFHIRDIPLTVPPSVDCSRYDRLLSLSGKQTDTMKEKHHAA